MASKAEICNLALVRLGANTITSLTDGTQTANLCNTVFDTLADEVMMEGPWTSTIRRADLNQLTTTPAFEYSYQYQLPTDPFCLKVLNVYSLSPSEEDYVIEDDKLLSDESSISIRYIGRLTDTGDWDPYLTRAFIARLASELAYPLTGKSDKAAFELERYRLFLAEGLAINNQQGTIQVMDSADLITVR